MSIDPSALDPYRDAMGNDANAFVIDIIDTFLATSGQLVDTLYSSLAESDVVTFTRAAHTLKSNSAIFGARHLLNLCKELETAGKSNNLNGSLFPVVEQLKIEYKQVCRELADLRKSMG
jgi:HPt (histidine-containing phosphotransfer) domain-containing protein